MVGPTESVKEPPMLSLSSATISPMRSVSISALCACLTILAPTVVGTTDLLERSKSRTSSSSSNFTSMALSVGCETRQASAAFAKLRKRSRAMIYLSCCRFMLEEDYWKPYKSAFRSARLIAPLWRHSSSPFLNSMSVGTDWIR